MIVFLTLAYIVVLLALGKLGIIRLTLPWKLSPIAWFLLLNIGLFIPMQWGAPAGPVAVFRHVIEIVPSVSGEVIAVPVEPLTPVKQGELLFQIDPRPFEQDVARLQAALVDAEQRPQLLAANVEIAAAAVARAEAVKDQAHRKLERSRELVGSGAVTREGFEEDQRAATVADRAHEEAMARLGQAKLEAAALTAQGENTAVAQARETLARAQYDLDHAAVRAPADGMVQQLALRPGARVAAAPLRAAVSFVDSTSTRVSMAVSQNQLRFVHKGQPAEIVLKYLPGMTLRAEVVGIAPVTSGGQVRSSGVIEDVSARESQAEPVQVVLKLNDDRVSAADLPGGAVGTAAIYTDHVTFTHVIRRVMLRMTSWLNYLW